MAGPEEIDDRGGAHPLDDRDMTTRFRAVKVGEHRRGIRLEQIYWDMLHEITQREGISLARYVEEAERRFPDAVNITSVLRVLVAGWVRGRNRELVALTGPERVDALVQACPSPAFALQEDKRIVAYNPPFLNYVQARFSYFSQNLMAKGLRLSLDLQVSEIVEALRRAGNKPLRTGFVLGVDDQRLRGQLSATLAPTSDKVTILGYVVQG